MTGSDAHATSRSNEARTYTPTRNSLVRVQITGFRSIRSASFAPGPVSALVGDPGAGKSNLLAAIRAALDPTTAPLGPNDAVKNDGSSVTIRLDTADGSWVSAEGTPPSMSIRAAGEMPLALYLPARLRAGMVMAPTRNHDSTLLKAATLIGGEDGGGDAHPPPGITEAAHGLVKGMEALVSEGVRGLVVLIEEPELFLPPQVQRYLYRLLRQLSEGGNQILYSTHSPSFLNVARLHELVLIENDPERGTLLAQPKPLSADDEFRAYSEFDTARSELFLARAAVLVEGLTERLALPFVFHALGYDADRERISIVECGGKANIPLMARVSRAVGIPFVAVHDRDAPKKGNPNLSERQLNQLIGEVAGEENRIELAPDFEGISGLRGQKHKPARAWRRFAQLGAEDMPADLRRIVERAVEVAGPTDRFGEHSHG